MNKADKEQLLDNLFKELQDLMEALQECYKRDDVFEKKRKLLADIRQVQMDIIRIKQGGDLKQANE